MKKRKSSKSNIRKIYEEIARERVVNAFKSFDDKVSRELLRLREIEGITPSCKKGCYYCCRQLISVPLPEVHVAANYIKDTFGEADINKLKARTIKWFQWVNDDLPVLLAKGIDQDEAFYNYGLHCPLLVNGSECQPKSDHL